MASNGKSKPEAAPRVGRFNRFQTAINTVRYVPTADDGHFDPYAHAMPRPQRSLEEMERVARVEIPGA
jgi:hypothetical protein